MQYVPNRKKICSRCGKIILYNEEYTTIDQLGPNNEVSSFHAHTSCNTDKTWGQYQQVPQPWAPPGRITPWVPQLPHTAGQWKTTNNSSTAKIQYSLNRLTNSPGDILLSGPGRRRGRKSNEIYTK